MSEAARLSDTQLQEEFETWWDERGFEVGALQRHHRDRDCYVSRATQYAWIAWHDARRRAPVRAPTDERGDGDYIRRLLEAAKCPSCDNSGTTRFGEECEWCFCRKRALAVPVSAQTPAGDALLWRATDADPAALTRAGGTVPISRGVTSTAPPAQPSKVVAALRKWREQQVSTSCCAVMLEEIDAALAELSREGA
jgi:hypothetical protein